jgi:hypothetical protein
MLRLDPCKRNAVLDPDGRKAAPVGSLQQGGPEGSRSPGDRPPACPRRYSRGFAQMIHCSRVGARIMRDKLIRAVREHREAQGQCTGYFLVTFSNGDAFISGQSAEDDPVASEIIQWLATVMDEEDDEIGPCAGHA